MKRNLLKYGGLLCGTFLFALAVNLFLIPSKIVTGGLSGIATILYHTLGWIPGMVIGVGNIIMCILAWIILGKNFVFNSLFGIISITFFVSVTEFFPAVTTDLFLSAVFGGILMGVGIGMTFIQGGTTGGTDILSRISQKKHPQLSIGVIMTIVDLIIIGASAAVFKDTELSMYGIISLVVSTAVIDGIIARLNSGVLVFVITTDAEKIKKIIYEYLKRGVTVIEAIGGFSEEKRQVLMCVMKKKEIEALKKIPEITDKNNFMIVTPSKEVFGEGFRYYR